MLVHVISTISAHVHKPHKNAELETNTSSYHFGQYLHSRTCSSSYCGIAATRCTCRIEMVSTVNSTTLLMVLLFVGVATFFLKSAASAIPGMLRMQ